MATRKRRARKTKRKTKLVLVLLPIILFAIVLAWLFIEEVGQVLDMEPAQTRNSQSAPAQERASKSTEKILDPERENLEKLLKNR